MKKSQLRNRIILYATIGVITVGLVILILLLVPSKEKTADASMQVAFGSLSSNLSSTGTVNKVTAKQDIPLALFIDEEDRDFFEKLTDSEKISLDLFLEAESRNVALFYHVKEVNEAFAEESLQLSTADEEQTILTLVPLRVRWELIPHADIDISDRAGKRSALFSLLKLDEVGIEVFGAYLDEYLEEDTAEELRITNTLLAEKFVKKQITYSDTVEYGVSAVKVAEGDRILPSEVLTKISISEWMTAFRLSEYDVRYIHERMLNDERVYAAVGVNALNGQRVLAEITKIGSANVSSGISYFTISARLIFPRITFIEPEEEDGKPTEKGDFSYYDEFLDDTTVKYLGVDLSDNLATSPRSRTMRASSFRPRRAKRSRTRRPPCRARPTSSPRTFPTTPKSASSCAPSRWITDG